MGVRPLPSIVAFACLVFSNFMSAADSSPDRIVRWEILKGLPGEGPIPKHFHLGRPTPWAQGVVVRFWKQDGTEWVGNFQGRTFGVDDVLLWPEAKAVAVIAGGDFYLIDDDDTNSYSTLGSQCSANGMMLDERHNVLV